MIMWLVVVVLFIGIADVHSHGKGLFEEKVAFYSVPPGCLIESLSSSHGRWAGALAASSRLSTSRAPAPTLS